MNKLILVMVLLFSVTATAENLKYKRDDTENMSIHFRCNYMAIAIGLSADREERHLANGFHYNKKVWESLSKEDREKKAAGFTNQILAEYNFLYRISEYQRGWVDGFFANRDATEQNKIYYKVCEDDQLLFMTPDK